MITRTHKDKDEVLRQSLVALMAFSENALSPTQKKWARARAENCLWALGVQSFKGYEAKAPEPIGETVDLIPDQTSTPQFLQKNLG